MPYVTAEDGIEIYYTDFGEGRPVLLSHGWPLNSDMWQREVKLLADAGFRVVSYDRRGHGRSGRSRAGNDMDSYARDVSSVVEALDLRDAALIGHSAAGTGELLHYAAGRGASRVARMVLIGAEPRSMVLSDTNPTGIPRAVFDSMRAGVLNDRAQFWTGLADAFFGTGPAGEAASQGTKDDFWRQAMLTDLAAAYDAIAAFSETDQTGDLAALTIPVFIAHGEDDQIIPAAAAEAAHGIARDSTVKVYRHAPHGIHGSYQRELFADILDFLRA